MRQTILRYIIMCSDRRRSNADLLEEQSFLGTASQSRCFGATGLIPQSMRWIHQPDQSNN
ncbi:hypothetical protein CS542_01785 [Pedobacter sp. IW39]|nr:hypothetical protein CS542_01785 [Pedobacter sp. IW39]